MQPIRTVIFSFLPGFMETQLHGGRNLKGAMSLERLSEDGSYLTLELFNRVNDVPTVVSQ